MKAPYLVPLLLSSLTLALPSSHRGPQTSSPKIRASAKRTHPSSSPNDDDPTSCQIPHNLNDTKSYCQPPVIFNATLLDSYLCGDPRLGPVKLPTIIPLVSTASFYHRFGPSHLCPAEFLNKYWNFNATPNPYWFFPEHDGFALDTAGNPITGNYSLEVGTLVDRFGEPSGRFVSPAATPYIERALPPNNLDTPQDKPQVPYNYHLYSVAIAFDVEAGPIAPWFEQPGQGVQYHLPENKRVQDLVASGYLVEMDRLELDKPTGED